jgi:hypothetical protein
MRDEVLTLSQAKPKEEAEINLGSFELLICGDIH